MFFEKGCAMTTPENTAYSDSSFWEKLKGFALKAGREVIEKALYLYYAAQRPETPAWAKTVIYGALAYFISPLDAIPDAIPLAGFSDDLGALAAAVAMVSLYITADVKGAGETKIAELVR
jgi:uncharacterized membrane protein YkvA (DUF1232 family)